MKKIIVKVETCSLNPKCWYANQIGKEFEVIRHGDTFVLWNDLYPVQKSMIHHILTKDASEVLARISPEQVEADSTFRNSLNASLTQWRKELAIINDEIIDMSIRDAKAGQPSDELDLLCKREGDLVAKIEEAEKKLGTVNERVVASKAFNGLVNQIVNNVRP